MTWWYYRGRVTTPVDIPGQGPTVIRPRERFQAPLSAVAHLRKLGMVVACKPPKEEVKAQPKKNVQAPKQEEVRENSVEAVVTSIKSEPVAVVETKVVEEKPTEEEKEKSDKEKSKRRRSSWKKS